MRNLNLHRRSGFTLAALVMENGNKMTTGSLGTRPLRPALSANGHHDLAGILMQQREYPSWGYEVDNGATTIGERRNSYIKGSGVHEPSMNSFSHYAFGAVCEWMMGELAGIDRAAPGFDRVEIAPRPTGTITHAAASMEPATVNSPARGKSKAASSSRKSPFHPTPPPSLPCP